MPSFYSKVSSSALEFCFFQRQFSEAFDHSVTKLQISTEMLSITSATAAFGFILFPPLARHHWLFTPKVSIFKLLHVAQMGHSDTEYLIWDKWLITLPWNYFIRLVYSTWHCGSLHSSDRPCESFGSHIAINVGHMCYTNYSVCIQGTADTWSYQKLDFEQFMNSKVKIPALLLTKLEEGKVSKWQLWISTDTHVPFSPNLCTAHTSSSHLPVKNKSPFCYR